MSEQETTDYQPTQEEIDEARKATREALKVVLGGEEPIFDENFRLTDTGQMTKLLHFAAKAIGALAEHPVVQMFIGSPAEGAIQLADTLHYATCPDRERIEQKTTKPDDDTEENTTWQSFLSPLIQ